MRWDRSLQTVDVHCCGEIGRVITGGVLNIPGKTMADKLRHINDIDDHLRKFLCSEPRSGPAGSFCLLLPPTIPEADVGMIVLQPDKAHAMSGSNAMCTVTAVLETGMVKMIEPETIVTLDTAAGPVRASAECKNGKVQRVSLDMPAAFVINKDALIDTPQWGSVKYDLCFGGVFYALIDVDRIGLRISPENARELAITGVALRKLIAASERVKHPIESSLDGLAYVMFTSIDPDGAIRTCTTLRPGRIDRSPCGTGSNANIAAMCAKGRIKPGDRIISRSIIGSEFTTEFVKETNVGPFAATQSTISGQSWIYAITQIGLDPADPFPNGFTVADTWGS